MAVNAVSEESINKVLLRKLISHFGPVTRLSVLIWFDHIELVLDRSGAFGNRYLQPRVVVGNINA